MLSGHHSVWRKLQAEVQRQFRQGECSLRRHRLLLRRPLQVLLFKHCTHFSGKLNHFQFSNKSSISFTLLIWCHYDGCLCYSLLGWSIWKDPIDVRVVGRCWRTYPVGVERRSQTERRVQQHRGNGQERKARIGNLSLLRCGSVSSTVLQP